MELLQVNHEKEEYSQCEFLAEKYSRFFSKIKKDLGREKRTKKKVCLYCNEEHIKLCNSHLIPQFVLKNISKHGQFHYWNEITNIPGIKNEKGIIDAKTFKNICVKCDGKIFQEYENANNYDTEPTQEMLHQIKLKNILWYIDKYSSNSNVMEKILENEKDLYHDVYLRDSLNCYSEILKREKENYNEYKTYFNVIKNNSNRKQGYEILYFQKLQYVVPVAFQGDVVLAADFKGHMINNIYNYNKKYHLEHLSICIFPLITKTIVIMFLEKGNKRHNEFKKQFNMLNDQDKIAVINYIVFLYSEDYILHLNIKTEELSDKFKQVAGMVSQQILDGVEEKAYSHYFREKYNLSKFNDIENLLSKEYCLENIL